MIKMARCLKNGTEIPRKILGNGWDELIDKNCLINGMKAGRLVEFKADGRAIFLGNKNSEFILDINDIDSLHIIR
jgi:hypothetical protein